MNLFLLTAAFVLVVGLAEAGTFMRLATACCTRVSELEMCCVSIFHGIETRNPTAGRGTTGF